MNLSENAAAFAAIAYEVKCPSCGAVNREFSILCAWDDATGTVICLVQACGYRGPLSAFLLPKPTPLPEGDST